MSFDAHANFGWSTVATPPSPPTSGTSLIVAAGQGALFPAAPFNCLLCPANTIPTAANAEIVRVTNVSTDTLTIVRAQESSSAVSAAVGYVISNAITAKTLTDIETSRASATTFGLCEVDGTTITSVAGVLSAVSGGSGNVSGPASSTTNDFASFADTTGKLLKDSGLSSASFDAAGSAAAAQAASYPGLGAIPLSALATETADTLLGNNTGSPAVPAALTVAQVKTLLAYTATDVGLGNVTNDAQTKAAIVPNTVPTAGQILAGNAGGTAYAAVTASGDATISSAGAITIAASAVTLAKMANETANTILGNATGSPAAPQALTVLPTAVVPAFTGDVTNTAGSLATTVGKINGTSLAGLGTGILKNTTATGVPSIAVAADFPTLNQNTSGTASNLSGTPALPNGTTATTQSAGDTTTKIATDAFVSTAQLLTYNAQTGTTYTLVLGDANLGVSMNNAAANTLTVPPNSSVAFVIGTQIVVLQLGAGATTIAAGVGVTINSPGGLLQLAGQNAQVVLEKTATNTWQLAGNISQTAASVSTVASGTAYTMTGSFANVAFGTTSPTVTLAATGTYLIGYSAQSSLVGATYAAIQQVNFLMNRQNNTPATIAGTSFSSNLPIVTTVTDSGPNVSCAGILYATANTTDIIGLQADVSATPAAGSVTCSAATITAVWLHA